MDRSARPFKDHFSDGSADYAAHRPTYPAALAQYLAAIAPAPGRAWEAGCGSGQLSVLLGDVFAEVIATDASARQIAEAKPHPHVRYRQAPAEASALAESSVDLVVSAQAAHWFDLPAHYAEVRRVARPGAAIALVSYGGVAIDPAIDRVVAAFYAGTLGPFWPAERRHVEAGYRSLPFPFPELVAPELAMTVAWRLADLAGYIGTWSAVRALKQAGGGGELDTFLARLSAAWGPPETARTIRWPLALRAGRVTPA